MCQDAPDYAAITNNPHISMALNTNNDTTQLSLAVGPT